MQINDSGRDGAALWRFDWTNATVVALGANLTGDVTLFTLPAKTVVKNAYVVITGQAAVVDSLTVAVGRTAAAYEDYIVASDAMVAANTVYGNAKAELGAALYDATTLIYDLPSITAATTVKAHFIATSGSGKTLANVTGSTGSVYLETVTLP